MFGHLFLSECKQTFKSLTYWLVVGIIAMFFFTQLGNLDIVKEPQPGKKSYGTKQSEDKNEIMQRALGMLCMEYRSNSYTTYPIGFAKSVRLDKEDRQRVGEILRTITGLSDDELENGEEAITVANGISYQKFENWMEEIDDMLGGGSSYGKDGLRRNAVTQMTYEDAVDEYNTLVEKEHYTGGYARLFCDYMGIVLALVPIFLSVTRGLRDRRAKMRELIAVRQASSAAIVVSRYLAMVVMIMIPTLLLSLFSLTECVMYANGAGIAVDYLAFIKYSFGWLLPTVMIATAVGTVLTEFTDTAVAILVQGIWWFVSLFAGLSGIYGGSYGWTLVPRHNTTGNYAGFRAGFQQLMTNRIVYAVFAIILVALTVLIYAQKRKGKLDIYGKIFGNRKRKSKA